MSENSLNIKAGIEFIFGYAVLLFVLFTTSIITGYTFVVIDIIALALFGLGGFCLILSLFVNPEGELKK